MLLTQEEWDDLAVICEIFKRHVGKPYLEESERRIALADRLIDAAKL